MNRFHQSTVRSRWLPSLVMVAALFTTARSRAEEYWHKQTFGVPARQAIMSDMYEGNISGACAVGGQYHTNPLYKAWCHNPKTNNGRVVFVKPHVPSDIFGGSGRWNNPAMEVVAHKMDVMLRGSWVPPAANRRWVDMGGWTADYATVIVGLNNCESSWAKDLDRHHRPYKREMAASELGIRAALLSNPDARTPQNTQVADHWVDGKNSVALMDWAGSGSGDHLLTWDTGIMAGRDIKHYNLATYQAMKWLTYDRLKNEMRDSTIPQGFLSDQQIHGILSRRDGILRHIDEQVRARGARNVFFTKPDGSFDPGPYGWIDPNGPYAR